uniref:BHLH domain-containing protein n=1 Tax=Parascaris univalens TaxID=6257 RepID=A0A914ZSI7_PARUN
MVDKTAACEIIDSRLPLKKRRINSTLNEAPLDFSLPSRERAKHELRSRACSSSPCSSKSSMVSDVEIEEDQRVPSNPKCSTDSSLQTMPIDLSIRSRRIQQSSEVCKTKPLKVISRQERLALSPSILFGHFGLPNSIGIFGQNSAKALLSLFEQNLYFASTSTPCSPVTKVNRTFDETIKHARDGDQNDEGGGYVINPTTGNRCKRNYKNVTVEKRSEANARERTRVQTIAATFEELRGLLPCDDDAKLSKLSILRIASKYIQYLGALMGKDFSGKGFSIEECLQILNETLESESRVKR